MTKTCSPSEVDETLAADPSCWPWLLTLALIIPPKTSYLVVHHAQILEAPPLHRFQLHLPRPGTAHMRLTLTAKRLTENQRAHWWLMGG